MKPRRGVTWFVEHWGVQVKHPDEDGPLSIRYPQAALWALISNGSYSKDRAVELTSILSDTSGSDAERLVTDTLAAWRDRGLISME